MPTYVIKRDGLVVGACTAEENIGPLAWFNRNVSCSMHNAMENEGYSFDVLMTRKDFWALHDAPNATKESRTALHREYNSQFLNNAVRALVKRRIGQARIEASQDEWFNDIPLREWDALNEELKHTVNKDVRRDIEPGKPGTFMWSLSHSASIAKCVAREIRDAYRAKRNA